MFTGDMKGANMLASRWNMASLCTHVSLVINADPRVILVQTRRHSINNAATYGNKTGQRCKHGYTCAGTDSCFRIWNTLGFFFNARKIVWSDACSPKLQIHTWFNVEGKEEVCWWLVHTWRWWGYTADPTEPRNSTVQNRLKILFNNSACWCLEYLHHFCKIGCSRPSVTAHALRACLMFQMATKVRLEASITGEPETRWAGNQDAYHVYWINWCKWCPRWGMGHLRFILKQLLFPPLLR